jgi:hypothetical protein
VQFKTNRSPSALQHASIGAASLAATVNVGAMSRARRERPGQLRRCYHRPWIAVEAECRPLVETRDQSPDGLPGFGRICRPGKRERVDPQSSRRRDSGAVQGGHSAIGRTMGAGGGRNPASGRLKSLGVLLL